MKDKKQIRGQRKGKETRLDLKSSYGSFFFLFQDNDFIIKNNLNCFQQLKGENTNYQSRNERKTHFSRKHTIRYVNKIQNSRNNRNYRIKIDHIGRVSEICTTQVKWVK